MAMAILEMIAWLSDFIKSHIAEFNFHYSVMLLYTVQY